RHRQRHLEGVPREGRVDVEVAEEDLLRRGDAARERRGARALLACGDERRRDGARLWHARGPGRDEPALAEHPEDREEEQDEPGERDQEPSQHGGLSAIPLRRATQTAEPRRARRLRRPDGPVLRPTCGRAGRKSESTAMSERPFRVLGLQQIAVGAEDKTRLRRLWVDLLGLRVSGNFKSERENVDEDIAV